MSNSDATTPSGTLEERFAFYSTEALPNSIRNISENSKNLTPVIEYLEQAYLTAPDQQAQEDVETQAKTYLVDALTTVVGDINNIAHNFEQFVGLQVEAVDGLGTQMELLRTKMTLYKEQHGTEKCSAFRDPVVTSSGTYSRTVHEEDSSGGGSSGRLPSVLLPSTHHDLLHHHHHHHDSVSQSVEEEKNSAEKGGGGGRVPLHERMSRLDDVGVCLAKEESKQSAKATSMATSSVLRRSSYNKQQIQQDLQSEPHSSLGPPPDDDDESVASSSSQGSRMVPPPRLSAIHH